MENTKQSITKIILFSVTFTFFTFSMDYFEMLPAEIVEKIVKSAANNINFEKDDSNHNFRRNLNSLLSRGYKSGYNLSSTCKRMRKFKKIIDEQIRKLLIEKYGEIKFAEKLFEAASGHHEEVVSFFDKNIKPINSMNYTREYWDADINQRIIHEKIQQRILLNLIKKLIFIGMKFNFDIRATKEMQLPKEFLGLTPLMVACKYSNLSMVKLLIAKRCKIDEKDQDGRTAFFRLITDRTIRHNLSYQTYYDNPYTGRTEFAGNVIRYCKDSYNYKIATLLLEAGADINIVDKSKSTPLMQALKDSDLPLMNFLVDHNADSSILNELNESRQTVQVENRHRKSCDIV